MGLVSCFPAVLFDMIQNHNPIRHSCHMTNSTVLEKNQKHGMPDVSCPVEKTHEYMTINTLHSSDTHSRRCVVPTMNSGIEQRFQRLNHPYTSTAVLNEFRPTHSHQTYIRSALHRCAHIVAAMAYVCVCGIFFLSRCTCAYALRVSHFTSKS